MKKLILTILLCLLVAGQANAIDLETLILGEAPPDAMDVKETKEALEDITKPTALIFGIQAGPDFNSDNEFIITAGFRYNLFEIGPTVHFWPNGVDDTAWGVYVLRHLSYDDILFGKPFIGFEPTVAGKGGDMYAFIAGTDIEIQPGMCIRTKGEYRNFQDALAHSHDNESDELTASVSLIFSF